jgi:hypothetical protein
MPPALSLLAAPPSPTPEPVARDVARQAAEAELSKPEYHRAQPNFIVRAVNWILEKLQDLIGGAVENAPGGPVGLIVLIALVVAGVVALRLRLGPLNAARRRSGDALFGAEGHGRTAAAHRSAADAAAARGDWDTAVAERLRAIVRALEERVVIDERPGRTADEATAEAGRHLPALADGFRSAARVFDDVRYGGRTATAAMDAALRDLDTKAAKARPAHATMAATSNFGVPK